MFIKYLILVVVLVLGSGCNQGLPIQARWETLPVSVCTVGFAEESVIEQFNDFMKRDIFEIKEKDCDITFEIVDTLKNVRIGTTLFSIKNRSTDPILEHAVIQIKKTVYYQGEKFHEFLDSIIAHELGHALGHIYHSEKGLMASEVPILPFELLLIFHTPEDYMSVVCQLV